MKKKRVTKMIDMYKKEVEFRREQYETRMKYFKDCVNNESETDCFERNAINYLTTMMELKSHIQELQSHVFFLEGMLGGTESDNG